MNYHYNMNLIYDLHLEEELRKEMESVCSVLTFEKNKAIVETGDCLYFLPLVLKGSVRVFRRDGETDREILLYYINPGQTCMMSLVACFGDAISKVNAVTDKKSKLLMIPTIQVREWQKKYDLWNSFIINTFMIRYSELLKALDELSFKNMGVRIHNYLKDYSERNITKLVKLTHQDIANELGTTRVVISRILKNMEKDGLVELKRGLIRLKDL